MNSCSVGKKGLWDVFIPMGSVILNYFGESGFQSTVKSFSQSNALRMVCCSICSVNIQQITQGLYQVTA